jgi:cell division protease FtsH
LGLLFQSVITGSYAVKDLAYSEFLAALEEGRIIEISMTEQRIQGTMIPSPQELAETPMSSDLPNTPLQDGAQPTGPPEQRFSTVRVDDDQLVERLNEADVKYAGRIESTFFRDLLSWLIPIFIFFGIWYWMFRRMGQQQGFLSLGKKKAKVYMQEDIGVDFTDVAGVEEAKAELMEVVEFLEFPDKYTQIGGKLPKGVLLVGPPGTGKTLLAKAVAGEAGVPFFSMSGSEFVELFVGMGAARVRDLFEQAKTKAPCIIFIDELDALGKARGGMSGGGHDEREQTLNQLLTEMDGFDPTSGIILMAATNRPEILDPALLRPGRFDRHVLVDKPDKLGREAILEVHMREVEIADDVDVPQVAAMTAGFAGADLANLVNEAALLAVRHGKDAVGMAEFFEAVERVVAGLETKNRLINEKERAIVAHHEIGHALVGLSLPGADPVRKISIVPRGVAALGYTLNVPTEQRFLMTKTELLAKLCMALGGRAAEEIVYGDVSTGAHNDLSKATDIARSMVKQYGMHDTLGHVYLEEEQQSTYLGVPGMKKPRDFSEQTAREIDVAVHQIIEEQYERAIATLRERREVLDEAAAYLLKEENIKGEELAEIMKRNGFTPVWEGASEGESLPDQTPEGTSEEN